MKLVPGRSVAPPKGNLARLCMGKGNSYGSVFPRTSRYAAVRQAQERIDLRSLALLGERGKVGSRQFAHQFRLGFAPDLVHFAMATKGAGFWIGDALIQ